MYTAEEVSKIKESFWLKLGKYLAPIPGTGDEKINWINYKTGVKDLYFKMDVTRHEALIFVEIGRKSPENAEKLYSQLQSLKTIFENTLNEKWQWESEAFNNNGQSIYRIGTKLQGVNILKEEDWPLIISFLKPRIILLDEFWSNNRMIFELIN